MNPPESRPSVSADMIGHYNFRNILFAYVVLFLALTFPYWLNGEVVAPYRQTEEIAAPKINDATHIENRKFIDFSNAHIPEISDQINGKRSGWLALWTNQNELGRPINHLFGFSPAYLPSWLIASVTDSPYRFITLLSLGTCFLAGLFVLMLCRELGLLPLAGLLASCSLAASPVMMYWLTYPMFTSVFCWSAGALFALTRLGQKLDLLGWSVLTFSFYSLLMTAYQQYVVFHLYILIGYGVYLTYRHWQSGGRVFTTRYLATVASAAVVGGVLALPVYLDLASMVADSARVAPDPSFFTEYLPKLDSLFSVTRFLVFSTYPEIFGNPISPSYNSIYNGLSATPLVSFLVLSGLFLCLRKTWGWWLAVIVFCTLAFIHPLYLLGVKYLGFNLSPMDPLGCITLPLTMIAAYGADALIRHARTCQHSKAIMFATVGTVLGLLVAVSFGLSHAFVIHWGLVVVTFVVVGFLAAQFDRTRPALLIAALVVVGTYVSFPLMLRQEPDQIATSSLLVEMVRANLPLDSRYAVASPGLVELLPNLNATLRLPSIHSYNSLSSQRYHALIEALGGKTLEYGRWNNAILPNYTSAMFWMSNIALMLSPTKLEQNNLDYLGQLRNIYFYRVVSRMGCCLQVILSPNNITTDGVQIDDPSSMVKYQSTKALDQGDLLEFDVQGDSQASLLILSQKFHQDWHAQVLTASGWSEVKTVPVNGVFQGVLLPERVQKVQMQFKPFVRFAWIAHVFWLLVLVVLFIQALHPRIKLRLVSKEVSAK